MGKEREQQEDVDISSFRHCVGNISLRYLWTIALRSLQPKYLRLLRDEAVPHLNPARLNGVFSELQAHKILSADGIWKGFYEIADIIGSQCFNPIQQALRVQATRTDEPPFDLTMTVAHTWDADVGVVESLPCNVIQKFQNMFDLEDEATRKIFNFISSRCQTGPAQTALVLEIRGEHRNEIIEGVNATIAGWKEGYGYTSRVIRPQLSAALQSAISRAQTREAPMRYAITVTDTRGPNGEPIVVYAPQNGKIRLSEGEPNVMAFAPLRVEPTRNYLVREL